MPLYDYTCDKCGSTVERHFTMKDMPHEIDCTCGSKMYRSFGAGCFNVDADNVRFSLALGMNPEQISSGEAQRVHPGAEFDELGRMKISNRAEKLKRMRERGLRETD